MEKELSISEENLFSQVLLLPQEKFNFLSMKFLNETKNDIIHLKNETIDIKNESQEIKNEVKTNKEILDSLVERQNCLYDENYKNVTNLGLDFEPSISPQAMNKLLNFAGITKFVGGRDRWAVKQPFLNGKTPIAIETTKVVSNMTLKDYKYHSTKTISYIKKQLEKNGLLIDFNKINNSGVRNKWITDNIKFDKEIRA